MVPRVDDVTFPVAELDGQIVWAADLASQGERPEDLACVGCAGRVLLRAGSVNRPHFAHRDHEACSAGETVLHRTTCRVVAEALEAASRERRPYPVEIWCPMCRAGRTGNLALREGLTTSIDQVLADGIRPDVLVSADGAGRYVIEVVVTHAPENTALEVFARLGLPVLVIRPTWELLGGLRTGLDGYRMQPGTSQPGSYEMIGRCTMPRHVDPNQPVACGQCDARAMHLTAETSIVTCWGDRCGGADVRVMDLYTTDHRGRHLLAVSAPGLEPPPWLVEKVGARLSVRNSRAAGGRYLMHQCNTCGAPQGDNFLYGGLGEAPTVDVARPVHHVTLCAAGHWSDLGSKTWPTGSVADRPPVAATGTCGNPPGPFELDDPDDLASVQSLGGHDGISVREAINRMMGLDRL
jgi:hypothetical protein